MKKPGSLITEIDPDSFWWLIDEAKAQDDPAEWLKAQLVIGGSKRTMVFDTIAQVYVRIAFLDGIWAAAAVMDEQCCSVGGFYDFKLWLIDQGKAVYLAALKDPDSLADAPPYPGPQGHRLSSMGGAAYEVLTGHSILQDYDADQYRSMLAELEPGIEYGIGITYPRRWPEIPGYLPKLCAKYLTPERQQEHAEALRRALEPYNKKSKARGDR